MTLLSKDHYELMDAFEKAFRKHLLTRGSVVREPKEFWPKGRIYQDMTVNELFLAYRMGAAHGAAVQL